MNITRTPDGIPVVEFTVEDMVGPEPAGFTALVDQVTVEALARAFDEGDR